MMSNLTAADQKRIERYIRPYTHAGKAERAKEARDKAVERYIQEARDLRGANEPYNDQTKDEPLAARFRPNDDGSPRADLMREPNGEPGAILIKAGVDKNPRQKLYDSMYNQGREKKA